MIKKNTAVVIRNFYTPYIYIYKEVKDHSIFHSQRTSRGGRAWNEITTAHRHRNRVPLWKRLWPNVQHPSTIEIDRKRPIASIILFGTVRRVSCACVYGARRVYKRAYSRVNSLLAGSTRLVQPRTTTRCNFCSFEF